MMARQAVWLVVMCALSSPVALRSSTPDQREIGRVGEKATFVAIMTQGKWGLAVSGAGMASVQQPEPIAFEFYQAPDTISHRASGYDHLEILAGGARGTALIVGPDKSQFTVEDQWSISGSEIQLSRKVTVACQSNSAFLTAITFSHPEAHPRSEVDYFAPGMIYGSASHLSAAAIGGSDTYTAGSHGEVQIREDRLPAPLFGVHFSDGSGLTVLDPTPDGATTKADSHDVLPQTMVDERYQFGALGVHLAAGHHEQGFWFPGSEGEFTYAGNTYPDGQKHVWRRRYHPIQNGLTQQYRVQFRFSNGEKFPTYYRNAWRWAYHTLNPPVTWQDISLIQRSIIDVLASQVATVGDRAGIPNFISSVPGEEVPRDPHAILGFTGKNLESAEFLLADAQSDPDAKRASRDRNLGLAIFQSFVRLRMNPPVGEGFDINTGEPQLAIPHNHCVYLRSFGDDMKATLRAYRREKLHGISHPDWLAWTRQFGDWLLTQQQAEGGFPRSWAPVTGVVTDASPASSYNPIPFLVLLSQETGEARYLKAAERAADFVWTHGQSGGQFVGGTIDNPDVLDKEAGTLSTEAYLALYEATKDSQWLDRARVAADYAETYIYLWNVPMPADEDDKSLHWKKGVPTYGVQLIATGHSLVDDYMSFDVDEYARLARWTGDQHYMTIATLLLHDTKNMTAVPGRTYDLKGPGWQQEHWSMAPIRGFGLHRGWLPWVATSQLKGIFGLRDFDPELFRQLSGPEAKGGN
jgi:N-acylglucosamine 2-epimerase (GlcNAc 2-epimerase)